MRSPNPVDKFVDGRLTIASKAAVFLDFMEID